MQSVVKSKTGYRKTVRQFLAAASLLLLPAVLPALASAQTPDYSSYFTARLQSLAQSGDAEAIFTLGVNLIFDENGIRPDADFAKAKALLTEADNRGHDAASSILTLYYDGEFGGEPDPVKLEAMLSRAAVRGSGEAKLNYGMRFLGSEDTAKSNKAMRYLKQATADETVRDAAYPALIEVLYGAEGEKFENSVAARRTARECINVTPGNAICHFILAQDLENGWGGPVNKSASLKHYLEGAKLGEMQSQWALGMKYLNGDGVAKNERTAFELVKKSADQDYHDGLLTFAAMNALGQGTPENKRAAFETYERAASFGSGPAMRGLGAMYCVGDAPKTDKDLCAAALILAYDMEDDPAADLLGEFFQVEDQASYDALKSRTSASRTELMRRYNLEF